MKRKKLQAAVVALAMLSSAAISGEVFSQNFDSNFNEGEINGKKSVKDGEMIVESGSGGISISKDAASGPYALRVSRVDYLGTVTFKLGKAIPIKENFRLSFKIKAAAKNGTAIFVGSGKQGIVGAVGLNGGDAIKAYDKNMRWQNSMLPALPTDKYTEIIIDFNAETESYEISMVKDGETESSPVEFPYLKKENISAIWVVNSLPKGSAVLYDDIKLEITEKTAAFANLADNGDPPEQRQRFCRRRAVRRLQTRFGLQYFSRLGKERRTAGAARRSMVQSQNQFQRQQGLLYR